MPLNYQQCLTLGGTFAIGMLYLLHVGNIPSPSFIYPVTTSTPFPDLNHRALRELVLDPKSVIYKQLVVAHSHQPYSQYPSLSCILVKDEIADPVSPLKDPNKGKIYERLSETDPPFHVSLHNKKYDKVRWGFLMQYGLYYETYVTDHFKQILGDRPRGFVIDIGSNIGWFSLWAAALGHKVFSFEPNPVQNIRLCESIDLNHWDSDEIEIFPYGFADRHEELELVWGDNPGAATFKVKKKNDGKERNNSVIAKVITFDTFADDHRLFEKREPIVVLKMDAGGFEPEVLRGARRMLKTGLIENIYMVYSGENYNEGELAEMIHELYDAGYVLKHVGNGIGRTVKGTLDAVNAKTPDVAAVNEILYRDCRKKAKDNCNLWWAKAEIALAHKEVQIKSLSCNEVMEQVHDEENALTDPNEGKIYERVTETIPSFLISLHNKFYDKVRWNFLMEYGLYYETYVTEHFKEILYDRPPSTVIDVGANVGWYALWSAALGHRVLAFEPNTVNHIRICESLDLNHWDSTNVQVFPYGLGDSFGESELAWAHNPGAASFHEGLKQNQERTNRIVSKIITLDAFADDQGIFENQTPVALMKVDAAGSEPDVIRGSIRLLKSGLVENIYIAYKPSNVEKGPLIEMMGIFYDAGYTLKYVGNAIGREVRGALNDANKKAPDVAEVAQIISQGCKTRGKDNCNIWWTTRM